MKLDFYWRLKLATSRFFGPRPRGSKVALNGSLFRDDERDRSAREYELYYWSSTPGSWY